MAESTPTLLSPEELEASRSDLESAGDAVSKLPPGLVKRRMEAALKGVEAEIQSQLWGHLRSSSSKGTAGQLEGAATAAKVGPTGQGAGAGAAAAAAADWEMTTSDSPTGIILGMAPRARVPPRSALHAASLALHCLLVKEGFVCTGQDDKAGAIKGFAAPVRDVPAEKLVPDRWDADDSAVSFRYRRPDRPGKVYLFKAIRTGSGPGATSAMAAGAAPQTSSSSSGEGEGKGTFFLSEKGGEIMSADVDLEPLEGSSSSSSSTPKFFESEGFFETLFSVFRREVLWPVVPSTNKTNQTPSPASTAAARAEEEARRLRGEPGRGRVPQPAVPGGMLGDDDNDNPLRAGPPRFAGPPGVGPTPFVPGQGGDFGGDLFPSGVGGGGVGGLPGPGGLLGPGHPMFGGGGGAGYMEPRFDPYGPPMPGQPWGPGVPGRGAGRGGPAQGGPRGPPGGPDNDHLPPPGGFGNMYF